MFRNGVDESSGTEPKQCSCGLKKKNNEYSMCTIYYYYSTWSCAHTRSSDGQPNELDHLSLSSLSDLHPLLYDLHPQLPENPAAALNSH